ncbi:unnamed protein product [Echinostoma caproni]|uniref:Homeobox protein homothorax n=1 Tax=Echinostoma caproni TaxID=27848 RepID=A0A183AY94_9TREM|nr:unnamed protein product [Echinostoma caproni]
MNIYAMSSSSSLLGGPTAHMGPSGEVVDPSIYGISSGYAPSELRSILSDRSDTGGSAVASRTLNTVHHTDDTPRTGAAGSGPAGGTTAIPGPSARRLMHMQSQQQHQQQPPPAPQQQTTAHPNDLHGTSTTSTNPRQRGAPDVHNGTVTRSTSDTRSAIIPMDPQRLINSLSPVPLYPTTVSHQHQRASSDLNGDPRSINVGLLAATPPHASVHSNPNPVTSFARNIRGTFLELAAFYIVIAD